MRADGATRTIHEIGRLVPGASLVVATAQQRSVRHPGGPGMLVVATPGAEPVVSGGYALSLLLDGHQLWDRSDDDADASAIRCWSRVALLTQPAYKGGQLIFARNDPQGLSEVVCAGQQAAWTDAMLAERAELGLPPAVPSATVSGAWSVVVTFLDSWRKRHTGTPLRVLGPIKGETATAMVVPEPGTDDTGLQHWLDVAVDHVKHLRQERVVRGLPVPTVVIAPA